MYSTAPNIAEKWNSVFIYVYVNAQHRFFFKISIILWSYCGLGRVPPKIIMEHVFYIADALPVFQPTASKQRRKLRAQAQITRWTSSDLS